MIKEMLCTFFAFSLMAVAMSAAVPEADVSVSAGFDSVCPCSTITADDLSVTVKNLDDKEATYSLSITLPDGSWSGFIVPEVTLAGGAQEKVPVFVTPSCFVEPGQYTLAVSAYSNVSGKSSGDETEIEVGKCRWIGLKAGEMDVCQGKQSAFVVNVENGGTETENVKLSTDIGWANFTVDTMEVKSGETVGAVLSLSPPKDLEGTGEITVSAYSGDSYARSEIAIPTDVLKCYAANLTIEPEGVEVCPCKSAEFKLSVKNNGILGDNFTVSYGSASEKLSIESGKEKVVEVSVGIPCDSAEGDYPLDIIVTSNDPYSPIKSSGKISVFPFGECYSVSVGSDDVEPSVINVGESGTYMITIANEGKFAQDYSFSVDGPEWVHLSEDGVNVDSGKSTWIYMYAAPGYAAEAGNYTVTVRASSDSGEKGNVSFRIAAVSDFSSENEMEINSSIPTGNVAAGGDKSWPQIAMITILAVGVVFVLILRFIVMMK